MSAGCFEAVPNFSEGADAGLIADLGAGEAVLDVHADARHGRCVVTLAAGAADALVELLLPKLALAVERIDLGRQAGLHPRVGAADVAPIVPLGEATMAEAEQAARRLAGRAWSELRLPVFFYGSLAGGRRLADIRRGRVRWPDLGGPDLHPTAGALCVAARPPLVAYNLTFGGLPAAEGRRLAAGMRRLPGVQALSFAMSQGRVQLSMNLTRPSEVAVAAVFEAAARLAGKAGEPELVGLCPAAAAGPGCDGALLEGRLAAQAARRAARLARERGGREDLLLARRFEAEAAAIARLAASPEALLAGAERAEALRRVLLAARLNDEVAGGILRVAARGLRAALRPRAEADLADRVRLLDRWLSEPPGFQGPPPPSPGRR